MAQSSTMLSTPESFSSSGSSPVQPGHGLDIEGVTHRFGEVTVLNQIHLQVEPGEFVALLGPSGCGKTTLLRLVAGFLTPTVGRLCIDGQRVEHIPTHKRNVGIVFQNYALFPHMTVFDNIAYGLRAQKTPASKVRSRVQEMLELVQLEQMGDRYPNELSGGQQQRVALARALAPRPPLILLDEPFSNLDVQVRLRLRQEVRDILKSIGASGIFVTHDQEEALAIADKVAVMQNGRLVQLATPEEIYQAPASRFIAEFVTQANFVAAYAESGYWQTEIGAIAQLQDDESAVGSLMIAQEDVKIIGDERGDLIVQGRQFLGREYQYVLGMGASPALRVRTGVDQRFSVGERVSVTVDPRKVRFFGGEGELLKSKEKAVV